MAVEAPGAQKGGIENVRAVRGGHDHNSLRDFKAVHFDQKLVDRLLPLAAGNPFSLPAPSHNVDLVDKHDGGSSFTDLTKQVTHPGSANADERLDELRTRNGEERDARLTGHRTGQQGLAAAGRAEEKDAFGSGRSVVLEFLRVFEVIDDLTHLGHRFLGAGHVGKADPRSGTLALAFAAAADLSETDDVCNG